MILLLMLLWVAGAAAIGFPLARLALSKEGRLFVILAYSILAGHCLQTVILVFVWSFVPLGTGFYVVLGISAAVGCFSAWRYHGSLLPSSSWGLTRLSWGLRGLDTALIAAHLSVFAFLGYRVFTAAYSAWDGEAMFLRSGVTSWLTRGLFPPTNPLELSEQLHYRYGLNLLAATFSAASGELAPVSVALTIGLLLALMVLAFVGASCRVLGRPNPGLVAAILGLMGGSLLWCLRLAQVFFGGGNLLDYTNEMTTGLLWGASSLYMVDVNVSVTAGIVAFAIALWLSWEAVSPRRTSRSLATDVIALSALVYLGLFYEVFFVALLVALIGLGCQQSWESRIQTGRLSLRGNLGRPIVLGVLAVVVVTFRGGLLGGMSLTGEAGRSAGLVLNIAHFGAVVVPVNKRLSGWFPLLSADALIDTDFILLGLPLLMLIAWRSKNSYAFLGLTACATSLIAWLSIYPRSYPESSYHFGEAALVGYVALAPSAIAALPGSVTSTSHRVGRWCMPLLLSLLIAPGLYYSAWVSFLPPFPTQLVLGKPDILAGEFLKRSSKTSRILVVLPQSDVWWDRPPWWVQLYEDEAPSRAIRLLLATTAHSVPLGFSPDFNTPSMTHDLYREASMSFSLESLAALKIDWVYVLPSYLSLEQWANLQGAEERRELILEKRFGEAGTDSERWLYRVVR